MTSIMESARLVLSDALPATMQAVVCYNPSDYRLEECPSLFPALMRY